jgi:hypothetical protein
MENLERRKHFDAGGHFYTLFSIGFCNFPLGPLNFCQIFMHPRKDNIHSLRFPS